MALTVSASACASVPGGSSPRAAADAMRLPNAASMCRWPWSKAARMAGSVRARQAVSRALAEESARYAEEQKRHRAA